MFSLSYEAFIPGKEYLLLTFEGELNVQSIVKYAPRILVAIQHHKCYKLVEDYRKATLKMKASDFTRIQNFQVNMLEKIGIRLNRLKRAMVIDDRNISQDEMEFYKMLSINQGQNLMVFTDMLQAIDWSLENDQP
jgi:hypothetical protein